MSVQKQTKSVKTALRSFDEAQKAKIIEVASTKISYSEFLDYVDNEIEQSKRMAKFNYSIKCFKSDGVYQLNEAVKSIIGVTVSKEIAATPSGNSDTSMQTVDVQLADGTRVKVPYGEIALNGMGDEAVLKIGYDNDRHELQIQGKCQYRFAALVDRIVEKTKERLATDSIYKGVAIEVTDLNNPKILDLSGIDKEMMVISKQLEFQLNPIRSRILHPEMCVERGIPLKYGCLFEGAYGTGKTLLAFKLGKQALENGWAFVYLKNPSLLAETLRIVKAIDRSGHGVIVFVEDLDQIARGQRDASMQDILNTLDGGDTKDMNVITLFTTNHIELIEPTFLRGKRIGSVISMGYLDAETAEMFIRESFLQMGYTLGEGMDSVYQLIAESDIVPAFMAEIVETVKSNMIFQDSNVVKAEYIRHAVESYLRQMGLSKKKDMTQTPEMRLANAFKEIMEVEHIARSVGYLKAMKSEDFSKKENDDYQERGDLIRKGVQPYYDRPN